MSDVQHEQCALVLTLNRMLTGNGKPEDGVVFRLVTIERKIKTVEKLCWVLIGAFVVQFVQRWF